MADATSLPMLFLARILAGVAGASVGTASAYIADITPPENRSKRMGLIGAAFGIGFVLGPAIGGLLSQWSVVAPFWFAAVLSILNAVLMWVVLPEPDRHAARQQGRGNLKQTFEKAGSWRLGIVTLTYFIAIAGFAIVTVIYPQVSHRRFELNQSQISFIFVFVGLIGAAIQGGGIGRLVKRFGDVHLAIAGFAIMAISMMMMPFAGSVPSSCCSPPDWQLATACHNRRSMPLPPRAPAQRCKDGCWGFSNRLAAWGGSLAPYWPDFYSPAIMRDRMHSMGIPRFLLAASLSQLPSAWRQPCAGRNRRR